MTTSLVKNGNDQIEFTNKKEDGENEWDSLYDDSGQSLTDQFKKVFLFIYFKAICWRVK